MFCSQIVQFCRNLFLVRFHGSFPFWKCIHFIYRTYSSALGKMLQGNIKITASRKAYVAIQQRLYFLNFLHFLKKWSNLRESFFDKQKWWTKIIIQFLPFVIGHAIKLTCKPNLAEFKRTCAKEMHMHAHK